MKKALLATTFALMACLISCGGKNSKETAFNKTKRVLDSVTEKMNKTTDCDLVQELSITAMTCTDNVDAMTSAEREEILKLKNVFVDAYNKKINELNCLDGNKVETDTVTNTSIYVNVNASAESNDMPSDDLFELEEEYED